MTAWNRQRASSLDASDARPRRRHAAPYALAVALSVAMLLVRHELSVSFGERPLLILFVFPVIASALWGGFGPGLIATLVTAAGTAYFFVPPVHSFAIAAGHDLFQWSMLIVNGVLVSLMSEFLHRARQRETTRWQQLIAAQDALRQNESILQVAQRLAGIGNWKWDIRTDQHFWSEEIYHLYGRDPALPPATYPEVREYFTSESWTRLAAAVETALAQGTPYECDAEVICLDGNHRWIVARGEAVRDTAGAIVELHGTVQDITDRKRAELALLATQSATLEEQRQARLAALNLMEDALAARARAEAAHAALRESETKYRLLAENSAECIFWLGSDGRFKYISPVCERFFGHSPAAFLADPELMIDSIHPDDRAAYRQHLMDKSADDQDELEFRVLHQDGTERWISHHCQIIRGENGEYLGRRGADRDITERKRAEMALKQERGFLKTLVRTVPDLIWLKDPDGVYLACNPRFERFFGAEEADILGKTDRDFMDRDLADFFQQKDRETIAAGRSTTNEEEVTYADDGHHEILETIKTPMVDAEGQLIGVLGVARDITAIRRSESRLRQLSLAVEQSPESIVITDLDGRIEYVNEAFVRTTGYGREEVLGQNSRILQSGRTPPETYAALWATLTQGQLVEGGIRQPAQGRQRIRRVRHPHSASVNRTAPSPTTSR
jgi:PAS domain S-box-containing protein